MKSATMKRTAPVVVLVMGVLALSLAIAVPHAWAATGSVYAGYVSGVIDAPAKVVKSTSYAIVKSDGYLHGTNKAHTADYGYLWGTTYSQATRALENVTTLYVDPSVRSLATVKAQYKVNKTTYKKSVSFQGGLKFGPGSLRRVEFLLRNGKSSCTTLGGTYCFHGQRNLTTLVNFNKTKLTSIPTGCFYGSNLSSVVLPSTVKTVGNYAFQNCKNLWYVKFPAVKTIGRMTFDQCTRLSHVYLASKARVSISSNTFARTGNNFKVYVPRSICASYKAKSTSNPWSKYRLTGQVRAA